MKEAKAFKEQVDATRHKEEILKVRLQPWIDEAYTITASIEAKLMQLQATYQRIHGSNSAAAVAEQSVEEVQQAAAQCTTEVAAIQTDMVGIHAKISAPT